MQRSSLLTRRARICSRRSASTQADFGHLGLMVSAARGELAAAGVSDPPDVIVADAGYWHLEQMNTITGDGIAVLIPPDSSRRKNKPRRPGWNGGAYDFMRNVLKTQQ